MGEHIEAWRMLLESEPRLFGPILAGMLLLWIGGPLLAGTLAYRKNRSVWLFVLASLFLSPVIAIVVALLISPVPKRTDPSVPYYPVPPARR